MAVAAIEGPVMVAAGPGTGKTQILAARIANILTRTDVPPDAVLALTFTESGVRAMRERLTGLIGPTAYYVNIATFHSFCSDIIKSHPDEFVMTEDLEPLSDLQRLQIFREILDEGDFFALKPLTNHYFYVSAIIKAIQDLKREGILPADLEKLVGGDRRVAPLPNGRTHRSAPTDKEVEKQQELLQIYQTYEKVLQQKGLFDFEDMINFVVSKFKDDEGFLRVYQERYQYILVDEFQDTNNAQNEVINLLCSYWEEPNIFVVGDANQSIYRFQGASTENMVGFARRYPTCQKITLTKNYRSTQLILDAATSLISRNELRLSKIFPEIPEWLESTIKKTKKATSKVMVGEFTSPTAESLFVAQEIKNLVTKGVSPSEIAVIYRHNRDSSVFADALARFGLAYNLGGGQNILEDYDLQKFLLLLTAIKNSRDGSDDLDWFALFNYDFFGFDSLDVLRLSRFAATYKINLLEAIGHPDFPKVSKVSNPNKFVEFRDRLAIWEKTDAEKSFVEFFEVVLNESGFLAWVLKQPDSFEKLNRLNSLFSEVKKLNFATRSLGLREFLKSIELMQESRLSISEETSLTSENFVTLTTAHKAKGLEYAYVFIVGCADKKWGNNVVRELIKLPEGIIKNTDVSKKEKNEDERRLFYVALTRAKVKVYVTYAKSSGDNGGKEAVPSMFIAEIDERFKETLEIKKSESSSSNLLKLMLQPVKAINRSKEEDEFLREMLKDFKLSVTALDTYLDCHYKFKLNNILRTTRAKGKSLALGTAAHAALDSLFKEFISAGKVPSLNFFLSSFKEAAQKELLSKKDLRAVITQGLKILASYYEENKTKFTKPIFTEKMFGYGFGKVYLGDIPLVGKVDRVDLLEPGKKLVRVVDYKTGKPKTRGEIEGTTKTSNGSYKRQLVFYRLLIDLDRTFNYEFAEAELDFLGDKGGDSKREVFAITREETEELKKVIIESTKGIRGLDFPKTTDYKVCRFCDYKNHCWPEGVPAAGSSEQQELGI